MSELKALWPMSAISETYNQMFLSQQVKRNVIITSKNGKYELIDELLNDVRLKKISELHGIKV